MIIAITASPPTIPPVIAAAGVDWTTGATGAGESVAIAVVAEFPAIKVTTVDIVAVNTDPDAAAGDCEVDVAVEALLKFDDGAAFEVGLVDGVVVEPAIILKKVLPIEIGELLTRGVLITVEERALGASVEGAAELGSKNEAASFGFEEREPSVRSPAGHPSF